MQKYLDDPPSKDELSNIFDKLHKEAKEVIRPKEKVLKVGMPIGLFGLSVQTIDLDLNDNDAILNAMVAYPILIERPIVITETKARIGRPPESVLEILP